ncbi:MULTISPECIES: hypothetical protein [Pseudomonas syringae group]|uniref:Peptidase U49 n=3 Tax=Pseudomonas syringae group TaxID=136849 RepID=A0A2K4WZN2_PSESX|nr:MULTISPECIES: hypothetical protein [Pseudomonas syringae group]AVB13539.1 hypothetical protein BKM19_007900 [Pseudomonas amygdali pv. morsprunorum]KWS51393.1 hypothetical protein AL056_12695 [Pseudomonas amygdali pv. morsprunorum]KWS69594.1 hypothetical protein AL054_17755 [Pseudomonas amygdali pv. morsprunorum]MBI6812381.1 hypothetical protein [Pseudomonas amygdali]MDT3225226.1 hypothetical protein [Pseudomonas amygdali pv. morsprunorum]
MAELQNSYPAATHSLPGLSIDDRFSDLESLTSFLNGRGIETKNTRIDRYQRYLKIASDQGLESIDPKNIFKNVTDGRFQHGLDWYLYVLREVDELAHILKGLKVHVPVGVDERLRKIVGGSDFAALDKNSESRNIQFELRIASYFCLAGFIVRLDTETDIIASKGRQHFYIECKRISNSKQLEENLLKAKRQILARVPKKKRILHKYYGVIAVDVTRVAYTHNGLTLGITNDHAREVVQSALRSISEKIELIRFFSKKPPIIQCWLQIHIPGLIESPSQALTRFSSMFIVNPETAISCKAALLLLHNVYAGSDFSDPRESPSRKINTELNLPAGTQLWLSPNISDLMLKASDPGFIKELMKVLRTTLMISLKHLWAA